MEVSQLRDMFISKAGECIEEIDFNVNALENDINNMVALEKIDKAAYMLKTISFTMGYGKISEISSVIKKIVSKPYENKFDSEKLEKLKESFSELKDNLFSIKNSQIGNEEFKAIGNIASINHKEAINKSAENNSEIRCDKTDINADIQEISKNIYIGINEKKDILKHIEEGHAAAKVYIKLKSSTEMKGAKIFLIYTTAAKFGRIINLVPLLSDIEKGIDADEITFVLLSNSSMNDIYNAVVRISQLKVVQIENITKESLLT